MKNATLLIPGSSPSLKIAGRFLSERNITVTDKPAMDVTHLLLPVPSFEADGRIRGGGILGHILAELPDNITVIGGNLRHPFLRQYPTVDLLQDPEYLAENAAITAECALRFAAARLPVTLRGCPILIIGWGRIGKCLAANFKALGSLVTVAARKESDRAMLQALGYGSVDPNAVENNIGTYRVIFNTAPAPVIDEAASQRCRPDCLKIELASSPGIAGKAVLPALGLPGKLTPESSGHLIGKRVLRLLWGKEGAL